jgi:hypothetical protein
MKKLVDHCTQVCEINTAHGFRTTTHTTENMRKTLLIAAAALAASIISSEAQVYSQNIVGYVNLPFTIGNYTAIATPLQATGTVNNAETVLPALSPGDDLLFWNGGGFDTYGYIAPGTWLLPNSSIGSAPTINPGTPFFYFNNSGAGETNTFVGSVTLSNVVALVAGNYAMCAETAPVADTLDGTNLNLPLTPGDDVLLWNGGGYDTYGYIAPGTWLLPNSTVGTAPTLPVGEGFFYFNNSGATEYWTNNVTVQ